MDELRIRVSLEGQRLELMDGRTVLKSYSVSTSKHGAGEKAGSYRTPRGRHVVHSMIGAGEPAGTVFRGRRKTGEIYSEELVLQHPGRDWVLTRILWLSGTEAGRNCGGDVDTLRRYIYIHGTPYADALGAPASIGCIRMSDDDVIELYDLVSPGTVVDIEA
ncbi:MAG: L,D-transpeptidase [Rhodospirillaceae bacterium]|nr:L,D-transpeptidase [Rhodospirillaceae bacterium]